VEQADPPSVRFFVNPPTTWDATTAARVRNHFALLELGVLYASEAATELENVRYVHKVLHDAGGADALRAHLSIQVTSCENIRCNSWRSATYRALASSDWYCEGGFLRAP
jgi:hypothetical protein